MADCIRNSFTTLAFFNFNCIHLVMQKKFSDTLKPETYILQTVAAIAFACVMLVPAIWVTGIFASIFDAVLDRIQGRDVDEVGFLIRVVQFFSAVYLVLFASERIFTKHRTQMFLKGFGAFLVIIVLASVIKIVFYNSEVSIVALFDALAAGIGFVVGFYHYMREHN